MKTNEIKIGAAVKVNDGFSRILGMISDVVVGRFGTSYEITLASGEVEYVSGFVSGNEIGATLD